jgi:hypothetical protein
VTNSFIFSVMFTILAIMKIAELEYSVRIVSICRLLMLQEGLLCNV